MLRLKTFGVLSLHSPDSGSADALLSQPKSAALLLYLLLARPRGYVSRDRLCLLFWSDSDEEHARGALSQALTRIRRFVGPGVVEVRGRTEIRILPGSMECDVFAFEEAVAAGDHRVALTVYDGPFLSGFHAPHAPGFEEWSTIERQRLRRMAVEAARGLTHEFIHQGRVSDAYQAASRALLLAPDSEAIAVELVRALADEGDRPGALHLYGTWADILERELDLEPGEELRGLAADLRTTPAEAWADETDGRFKRGRARGSRWGEG